MLHAKKLFSEASGRMQSCEIVMLEATAIKKGNSQRITDGHGHGGARRGRKIQRARFFFHADVEYHFTRFGQSGFGIARERDDRDFQTLERLEKVQNLLGFP